VRGAARKKRSVSAQRGFISPVKRASPMGGGLRGEIPALA